MIVHFAEVKDNILEVKTDNRTDVYKWGKDNLYPNLIEVLINKSVTAKNCVKKASKAIYGRGFGDSGKAIVNKENQTLNEVFRIASKEYKKHNNCFIHVGYNGELEIKSIKIIPNTDVRKGKADDLGYIGKIIAYDNWDGSDGKVEQNDFIAYDKFNPNKDVIKAQIEKAGGIGKYKGQILHIQEDSNEIYSLSDLDTVLAEALLESNSQTFRSNGASKGFLNTKVLVVQPFSSEEERSRFNRDIKNLKGASNSGNILLLESSQATESLDSQIKLEDLTSDFNDELFKYSDSQAEKNICKAFNVPLILVNSSDSGLFGNSGELIKQAKNYLWEELEEERLMFIEAFEKLMKKFVKPVDSLDVLSPFEN